MTRWPMELDTVAQRRLLRTGEDRNFSPSMAASVAWEQHRSSETGGDRKTS